MNIRKLSIIIPAYNEAATIGKILECVSAVSLPDGVGREIVVVDDCSTDATAEVVKRFIAADPSCRVIYRRLEANHGKGYAVRTGISLATGDAIVIQDADMEYDPSDYVKLLEPIIAGESRVVYGSRIMNRDNSYSYHTFYWGGRLVSAVTTLLFNRRITDEPTCYKMFDASLLKSIHLTSDRFGFCPEVTAKVMRMGEEIKEVPISYRPRSKSEGKKIRWRDGLEAIWLLFKYRWADIGESRRRSGASSWWGRNLVGCVVVMIAGMLLFNGYHSYKWVYNDVLVKNLKFARKNSSLTFDQRMMMKLGADYEFMMYIKANTPDDAVILYPSPEAFRKEGSPFRQEIYNTTFASRFLYPRRLVQDCDLAGSPLAGSLTHVVVVNGVAPAAIPMPVEGLPPHAVFALNRQK